MTNKELLERCAKVMGIKAEWNGETETFERPVPFRNYLNWEPWNPITSVADAAELAIKCKVDVSWNCEAPNPHIYAMKNEYADKNGVIRFHEGVTHLKDHPTEQAAYCYAVCSVVAQMGGE